MTASKAIAYATVAVLMYAALSAGARVANELRAKFSASMTQLETLAR